MALARGKPLPPVGTPLPGGHPPAGGRADARTHGAICYDGDATTGHYVRYAIGWTEDRQHAMLAGKIDNNVD